MAKQYVNLAIGARGFPRARTKLDGLFYSIEAIWNEVESSWAVNLSAADGTLLQPGLTLRHGIDVLAAFGGASFPGGGLGQLGAWDFANREADPGRDDLARGSAVRLVYIPASDVVGSTG